MTTTVVYASTSDIGLTSRDDIASKVLAGTGTTQNNTDTYLTAVIGLNQSAFGEEFRAFGYYGIFDTSAISAGDVVTDMEFTFNFSNTATGGDTPVMEAYGRSDGGATWAGQWMTPTEIGAETIFADHDLATDGTTTETPYTMNTLDQDAAAAAVTPGGTTYLHIVTDGFRTKSTWSSSQYGTIYSADETGTTYDPYITVTHAAGGNAISWASNF